MIPTPLHHFAYTIPTVDSHFDGVGRYPACIPTKENRERASRAARLFRTSRPLEAYPLIDLSNAVHM